MEDGIAKRRLNVIALVDASGSMRGDRIAEVNSALSEIRDYLIQFEPENVNASFHLSVIPFSTDAYYLGGKKSAPVDSFPLEPIVAKGETNLEQAYDLLQEVLKKEKDGGCMPDFGGLAPIILLLSDGHPGRVKPYKRRLEDLEKMPWYRAALRYGVAIGLDDDRTVGVLRDFVKQNGDVIIGGDNIPLKEIIKAIVITASKVRSSSTELHHDKRDSWNGNALIQQEIAEQLAELEEEW